MKKNVLLLVGCFALGLFGHLGAQTCTVDTTFTTVTAFSPDPLPDACKDSVYDVDVTFVLPNDTTIFGFPATFVEHEIVNVTNVPPGITWASNAPGNLYTVTQGQITRGCMKISGTPTATTLPTDSISIMVRSRLSTFLGNIDTTNGFNRHLQVNDCSGVSRADAKGSQIVVSPNPTQGASTLSLEIASASAADIRLFDVMGREVEVIFQGNLSAGVNRFQIFQNGNYTPGIYFVTASLNGKERVTRKVVVSPF